MWLNELDLNIYNGKSTTNDQNEQKIKHPLRKNFHVIYTCTCTVRKEVYDN